MALDSDTTSVTAHCLCKAHIYTSQVPKSKLPLLAYACHCNSCRHATGALYSIDIAWPEPRKNVDTSSLKKYSFSNRISVLFCGTCSTPMFFESATEPHDLGVFVGTIANDNENLVRIADHIYVGDTIDGGATMWLRKPNADGAEARRFEARSSGALTQSAQGVKLPYDWPAASVLTGYDKKTEDSVPIRCKCKGVDFVLHRGDYSDKKREELPWCIDPENLKMVGAFCVCDSCRLFAGVDVYNWAYAELKYISKADGSPFPGSSLDLRKSIDSKDTSFGTLAYYASSPSVQRYFCSNCAACVFFTHDSRPGIVDVAIGLLEASDGARAEGIISWSFGDIECLEDVRFGWRENMMRCVEKEGEEWRKQRGYPKNYRRLQHEAEIQAKIVKQPHMDPAVSREDYSVASRIPEAESGPSSLRSMPLNVSQPPSLPQRSLWNIDINASPQPAPRMLPTGAQNPTPSPKYVDIRKMETGIEYKTADISEEELRNMVADSCNEGPQQWGLFMVLFPAADHPKSHDEMRIDPFPPEIRESFQRHWGFCNLSFSSYADMWSGSMAYSPFPGDNSWKGWFMRTRKNWEWSIALTISHNLRTKMTYVVVRGVRVWEADTVIADLSSVRNNAENPFLVPFIILHYNLDISTRSNQNQDGEHFNIQASLPMTSFYANGPEASIEKDLVAIQGKLMGLTTTSAAVTQLIESQLGFIRFFKEPLFMMNTKENEAKYDDDVLYAQRERLLYMETVAIGEKQINAYVKDACYALNQMVSSLTAQRDNETNLRISTAMASEAHTSTIMARASLRYGLDMRVIATVTLIFLPGTFVATFFSINFFNFDPENDGAKMSNWVWVYFVVTIVLTGIVLTVWRFVTPAKIEELLDLEKNPDPSLVELDRSLKRSLTAKTMKSWRKVKTF
ncbi:hypothetical protein CC78DRAFT_582841 [Lojkania enalia]|uniref:CENP-V/GFA domain-containing protein n=1 Tax=Lojkania enalia TaxID=147567 RepID=A0A9P4K439_9PLEO|nr:hypothetical protein CC78DRAFT_582841 [Didymosphaeria enalia]